MKANNEKIYCKGCTKYTGHTEQSILKEDTGEQKNIICKECGRVICKINGRKPVILPITNSQPIIINNTKNRKKIICHNCDEFSGWYKSALKKTLNPEQKVHLICQSCGEDIAILIGEKEEKHKKMKVSEVDKGYAGLKKYKTPKVVKRNKSAIPQLW